MSERLQEGHTVEKGGYTPSASAIEKRGGYTPQAQVARPTAPPPKPSDAAAARPKP